MAQVCQQPPEPFNFKTPDDWLRWKQQFKQFRVASGLRDEDATRQVSMLLYCLGEEAEEVLSSTIITDEERNVFDTVIGKFAVFFKLSSLSELGSIGETSSMGKQQSKTSCNFTSSLRIVTTGH